MSEVDVVKAEQLNLKERMANYDQEMIRIWEAIDVIKNRPPVWASTLITILVGAVVWFAKG